MCIRDRYQRRVRGTQQVSNMASITTVRALSDNFMYLIVDPTTRQAAVVDPVEPEKLLMEAESQVDGSEVFPAVTCSRAQPSSRCCARIPTGTTLVGTTRSRSWSLGSR
eukprot:TRINITY_DN2146_c0_g1_i1.p4 TRINITY_DN2146_c0_g1~~TRINITY_DN2146_c0_g1_i1.p4  ORF type:complete len:109 (+),score=29.49 TRINITY_DN2146_c0_g1_i1:175-501(+)